MELTLLIHAFAAGLGLVLGSVALYASKGATLHCKSGILLVSAMLTMALTGAAMAAFKANAGNMIAGVLTAYLVITALTTVRPPTGALRRLEFGTMLIALALGATSITLGFEALTSPRGMRGGIPFPIFFMFGTVALLAGVGDVRMIRSGGLRGVPRLTRHLWRMCYALWIAAASFFLGPRPRGKGPSGGTPHPWSARASSPAGPRRDVLLAVAYPYQTQLSGRLRCQHAGGGLTVRMTLVVHIIVGGLGLVSGFVALYSAKGATFAALARGGRESGLAYPLVMFGVVGLSAGAGDLRVLRSGALRGAPRLARHL
jgi:hypothetical protein